MDHSNIDFDHELDRGPEAYNDVVGEWWLTRSQNTSHRYAYQKIVQRAATLCHPAPRRIVDYGCGAGHLLAILCRVFPQAELLGLDGSSFLLEKAERRLAALETDWSPRIKLVETLLPNPSLEGERADLLFYVFPNIVPVPDEEDDYERHTRGDFKVARYLSRAREPDPEEETIELDDDTLYQALLTDLDISRNLKGLMKPGGACVRADYANAPRLELTPLVRLRLAFEEGSLASKVNGTRAEQLFELKESTYHRSKVLEDVYHQTRDESDLEGGYFITTLFSV